MAWPSKNPARLVRPGDYTHWWGRFCVILAVVLLLTGQVLAGAVFAAGAALLFWWAARLDRERAT